MTFMILSTTNTSATPPNSPENPGLISTPNLIGFRRYDIKLPVWNGPLDLLLDLVRASKVKIQDIPIKEITNQYLEMLALMKQVDTDLSADFLVMASTLILIKSRILIAEEMGEDLEDFETPRHELIDKLLVYEQFKKATAKLSEQEDRFVYYLEAKERSRRKKSFFDEQFITPEEELSPGWKRIGLKELLVAYLNTIQEIETPLIFQDREFSVEEKMSYITTRLHREHKISFRNLFPGFPKVHKQEVVVTFWGILELYKQLELDLLQDKTFGEIFLISGLAN